MSKLNRFLLTVAPLALLASACCDCPEPSDTQPALAVPEVDVEAEVPGALVADLPGTATTEEIILVVDVSDAAHLVPDQCIKIRKPGASSLLLLMPHTCDGADPHKLQPGPFNMPELTPGLHRGTVKVVDTDVACAPHGAPTDHTLDMEILATNVNELPTEVNLLFEDHDCDRQQHGGTAHARY